MKRAGDVSGPARLRAPGPVVRLELALLLLAVAACGRGESDWLRDTQADDPFVRTLAVVALGKSDWQQPEEVVRHLIVAMGDPDRKVSARAGQALLANERRAFPALLRQAGLPDAAIRKQLTAVTRRLGPDALPGLAAALAEPAPPAGPFLVDLLRQLGPDGRGALLEASRHQDARVQRAALRSLVGDACDRLDDADEAVRSRAEDELAELGPLAVREMTRLLLEEEGGMPSRRPAIRAWLASRGPADVLPFLAAHHHGEQALGVGEIAALHDGIGLFGEAALPVLRRELDEDEPVRRAAAAAALSGLGARADPARPGLLRLLDDPHEDVRLTAALALMHIGLTDEETLDGLVVRARDAALQGDDRLGRALGTAAVGGLLRQLLDRDPPDAPLAAWSRLDAWGSEASVWLTQIATHALDEDLRRRAAEVLAARPP